MARQDLTKNAYAIVAAAILVVATGHFLGYALTRVLPLYGMRDGVHAVFLANGQVYFGDVRREDRETLTLTGVYYLKLAKPVLSQEDLQDDADASLVKLGNELHGPEDRMDISRAQILFVEKLKTDSRVAKAIASYASSGGQTQ
jgi:hypothetical protein